MHLQATCPHAQAHPPRKNGTKLKSKRWNFPTESSPDTNINQN
jgi:hypothetical protein